MSLPAKVAATATPVPPTPSDTPVPPTDTPVEPPPVGGIALDPDLSALALETPDSSGPNAGVLAGVAAAASVSTYFVSAAPTVGGGVRFFGTNQGGTIYTSTVAVAVTQNGAPAGANPLQ